SRQRRRNLPQNTVILRLTTQPRCRSEWRTYKFRRRLLVNMPVYSRTTLRIRPLTKSAYRALLSNLMASSTSQLLQDGANHWFLQNRTTSRYKIRSTPRYRGELSTAFHGYRPTSNI